MKKTVRIVVTFICCCTFFLSFFHADLTKASTMTILPSYDPIDRGVLWNRYSTVLTEGQKEVANYIVGTTYYAYLSGRNWVITWADWAEKNFEDMVHFFEKLGSEIWKLTVPPTMATLDFTRDLVDYLSDVLGFVTSAGRNGFSGGMNFAVSSDSFGVPYNRKIINSFDKLFQNDKLNEFWYSMFPVQDHNPSRSADINKVFEEAVSRTNMRSFVPDYVVGYISQENYDRFRAWQRSTSFMTYDADFPFLYMQHDNDFGYIWYSPVPTFSTTSLIIDKNNNKACFTYDIAHLKTYFNNPMENKVFAYTYPIDNTEFWLTYCVRFDVHTGEILDIRLSDDELLYGFKFNDLNYPNNLNFQFLPTDHFIRTFFDHRFTISCLHRDYPQYVYFKNITVYEYVEEGDTYVLHPWEFVSDDPIVDNSGDDGYSIVPPEDDGVIDIIGITHDITPPDPVVSPTPAPGEPDPPTPTPVPGEPDPPVPQPVTGPSVIVDNYYTYEGDQYTYNEFNYSYNYYYYPSDDTFTRPSLDAIYNFLNQDFDLYQDGDNPFDGSFDYDNKSPFQYLAYMWMKTTDGLDFLKDCLHVFDESGISIVFMGGIVSLGIAGFFSKLLG